MLAGLIFNGTATNIYASNNHDFLGTYLKIQQQLAADKTDQVPELATHFTEELSKASIDESLKTELNTAASQLAKATDIKSIRESFKLLSQAMVRWHAKAKPDNVKVAYCSMAKGSWLQTDKDLSNPYYGSKMLRCGEWVN